MRALFYFLQQQPTRAQLHEVEYVYTSPDHIQIRLYVSGKRYIEDYFI